MTTLHFSDNITNYRADHNGESKLGISVTLCKEYENSYLYEVSFFVKEFTAEHILNKYESLFYLEEEEDNY